MKTWLKRLRGIVKTGAVWGAAWAAVGAVFGLTGTMTGATCATVLALAERKRTFSELTMPRMALWGAAAGVAYSALMIPLGGLEVAIGSSVFWIMETTAAEWAVSAGMVGLLGAGSSTTYLMAARRADRQLPTLSIGG